jgi:hypothetical protein
MSIVKDKTYVVNSSRYSCEEVEHWVNGDKKVVVTTLWKAGTVNITPRTDEEVELLVKAQSHTLADRFKPYEFTDCEFDATYDGETDDVDYLGWTEEEELEGIIDETVDGFDEQGVIYLEENGFFIDDSELVFMGEVHIGNEEE